MFKIQISKDIEKVKVECEDECRKTACCVCADNHYGICMYPDVWKERGYKIKDCTETRSSIPGH
jgi:hypothetical protein